MPFRTQIHRTAAVSTPLGPDVLLLQRARGHEEMGRSFEFDLDLLSELPDIPLENIAGHRMTLRLNCDGQRTRIWNGFVRSFTRSGFDGDLTRYRAVLVPWTWLMTRRTDCRIFHTKNVREIIEEVFKGYTGLADVDWTCLTRSYAKREYCVQYRESDFQFVSRLLEKEGIAYHFRHEEGQDDDGDRHTLVLTDAPSCHATVEGCESLPFRIRRQDSRDVEHVREWNSRRTVEPSAVFFQDYDFTVPSKLLNARARVKREDGLPNLEVFDYSAGYTDLDLGKNYAKDALEHLEACEEVHTANSNCRLVACGHTLNLSGHPDNAQNREYLITRAEFEFGNDEFGTKRAAAATTAEEETPDQFQCSFHAIDIRKPFRPARSTPVPTVLGSQTAIVTGRPSDEICIDRHSRIKVQFHWDRYGNWDDNSSCWIRVSQPWAGKNYGGLAIPRIGQEVIIDFLEGDPDRPIVTGRVYNGANMPPISGGGRNMRAAKQKANLSNAVGSKRLKAERDLTFGQEQVSSPHVPGHGSVDHDEVERRIAESKLGTNRPGNLSDYIAGTHVRPAATVVSRGSPLPGGSGGTGFQPGAGISGSGAGTSLQPGSGGGVGNPFRGVQTGYGRGEGGPGSGGNGSGGTASGGTGLQPGSGGIGSTPFSKPFSTKSAAVSGVSNDSDNDPQVEKPLPKSVAEANMMTSMKSNSLGQTGGSNEITMNDTSGDESMFIKAQFDEMHIVGNNREDYVTVDEVREVGNDRTRKVVNNEKVEVGNNQDITVNANRSVTVVGNETHTVNMCRAQTVLLSENYFTGITKTVQTGMVHMETVTFLHALLVGLKRISLTGYSDSEIVFLGDKSVSAKAGSILHTAGTDHIVDAAANAGLKSGAKIVVNSPDITLKGKGGFIRIADDGIHIEGTKVFINCKKKGAANLVGADDAPGAGGGSGSGNAGTAAANGAAPAAAQSGGAAGANAAATGANASAGGILGTGIGPNLGLADIISKIPGLEQYGGLAGILDGLMNGQGIPGLSQILASIPAGLLPPNLQQALNQIQQAANLIENPPTSPPALNGGVGGGKPPGGGGTPTGGGGGKPAGGGGTPATGDKPAGGDAGSNPGATPGTEPATGGSPGATPGAAPAAGGGSGGAAPPPPQPYEALVEFAESHGFTVTSTTGGTHNPGSAHGQGRAIDVRTRDKTDAEVERFIQDARAAGFHVRDERTRPPGQAVWNGPHLHLENRN